MRVGMRKRNEGRGWCCKWEADAVISIDMRLKEDVGDHQTYQGKSLKRLCDKLVADREM